MKRRFPQDASTTAFTSTSLYWCQATGQEEPQDKPAQEKPAPDKSATERLEAKQTVPEKDPAPEGPNHEPGQQTSFPDHCAEESGDMKEATDTLKSSSS